MGYRRAVVVPKGASEILANNIDGLKEFIQDEDIFLHYRGVIIEVMFAYARDVAQDAVDRSEEKAAYGNHFSHKDMDELLYE